MTAEVWKPVVGFEGAYEVSDLGRVRSLDRLDSIGRPAKGRVLVPRKVGSPKGYYLAVNMCLAGVRVDRLVHGIVMEAFVSPRPAGKDVMHLNHDRFDNRLVNLQWGTRLENVRGSVAVRRHAHGEGHGRRKLSEKEAREVLERRDKTRQAIADEYGVCVSTVDYIRQRKRWRFL